MVITMIFGHFLNTFIQQGAFNRAKVQVKTFIMLQKFSISNKCCSCNILNVDDHRCIKANIHKQYL